MTNDLEISSGWSHFGIVKQGHLQTRRGFYLCSKAGFINFFSSVFLRFFLCVFYFVFVNIRIHWKPLIQSISLVEARPFLLVFCLFSLLCPSIKALNYLCIFNLLLILLGHYSLPRYFLLTLKLYLINLCLLLRPCIPPPFLFLMQIEQFIFLWIQPQ